MKDDYHSKIAALTAKVEEEKERQRKRSAQNKKNLAQQTSHENVRRDRSRSQSKIELERYAKDLRHIK